MNCNRDDAPFQFEGVNPVQASNQKEMDAAIAPHLASHSQSSADGLTLEDYVIDQLDDSYWGD